VAREGADAHCTQRWVAVARGGKIYVAGGRVPRGNDFAGGSGSQLNQTYRPLVSCE
jgi:hypothetical protein